MPEVSRGLVDEWIRSGLIYVFFGRQHVFLRIVFAFPRRLLKPFLKAGFHSTHNAIVGPTFTTRVVFDN